MGLPLLEESEEEASDRLHALWKEVKTGKGGIISNAGPLHLVDRTGLPTRPALRERSGKMRPEEKHLGRAVWYTTHLKRYRGKSAITSVNA